QPVACQIAPGRDGCKIVVDLRHGAFPGGQRVPLDPSRVISGVNASNPLRKDRPMPVMTEPKLIAGNANKSLASAIARRMSMHRGMSVSLLNARVARFNDQEVYVEVYDHARGDDMYISQPTSNPANDNLMELLGSPDALRLS